MPVRRSGFKAWTWAVALSALAAFATAEIALRSLAYFHLPPSATYLLDDPVGLRVRPNSEFPDGIITNDGGFNDRHPAPSRADIVFIGDSFTFGAAPYGELFPHMVERELAERSVQVANLGIPGIGPIEYRRVLTHLALPLKPRAIVVTLFVGNDILQADPSRTMRPFLGGATLLQPPLEWPRKIAHSYVLRALGRPARKTVRSALGCDGADRPHSNDSLRDTYHWEIAIYSRSENWVAGNATLLVEHIQAMHDDARAAGIATLFVLAPSEMQVNTALRADVFSCLREDPSDYDFGRPQAIIGAALETRHLPFLDLLPGMTNAARNGALYRKYDTHWNRDGNAAAAKAIADRLRADRTLDAP